MPPFKQGARRASPRRTAESANRRRQYNTTTVSIKHFDRRPVKRPINFSLAVSLQGDAPAPVSPPPSARTPRPEPLGQPRPSGVGGRKRRRGAIQGFVEIDA